MNSDNLHEDKVLGYTKGIFESLIEDSIFKSILEISEKSLEQNVNVANRLSGKIYKGKQVGVNADEINDEIIEYIKYKCNKYFYLLGNPHYAQLRLKLKNGWIVSQYEHDYNPVHLHDGFISGIIYLKIPESISSRSKEYLKKESPSIFEKREGVFRPGSIFLENNYSEEMNTDGKIDFIMDSGPFDNISNGWSGQRHKKLITPKEKYLYLFPSWMMHTVYPFSGEGERRVFAFNLIQS